jgi:hypothetical protein
MTNNNGGSLGRPEPPSKEPTKDQGATDNDNRIRNNSDDTKPETMSTENQSRDESEATRNESHRSAERSHWRFEKIGGSVALIFTAIAGGGAALSAYAAFQAWDAADKSAKAAIEANKISSDTEGRQLRAYLIVSHGPLVMSDADASVDIKISHAGATPAYKVRLDVRMEVAHYPMIEATEKLFSPVGIQGLKKYEYASLYGAEAKTEMVKAESPAIMIQMVQRPEEFSGAQRRFYVHGSVRYFDIFGTPEQRYDFCYSFHPKYNPAGSEEGCEKYNKPG